jgi:hypothetical protein
LETTTLLIFMAPTRELLACGVLLLAGSAHAFVAAPLSTSCQRASCTMKAAASAEGAPVGRRELVQRTAQAAAAVAGVLAAVSPASAELGGFYEKVSSLQTMPVACNDAIKLI